MNCLFVITIVLLCGICYSQTCVSDYQKLPPLSLVGSVVTECKRIAASQGSNQPQCLEACKIFKMAQQFPICDPEGNARLPCQDTCESFSFSCGIPNQCSPLPSLNCTYGPMIRVPYQEQEKEKKRSNLVFQSDSIWRFYPDRAQLLAVVNRMTQYGSALNMGMVSASVPLQRTEHFACYNYQTLEGIPCSKFNSSSVPGNCIYYETLNVPEIMVSESGGYAAFALCNQLAEGVYGGIIGAKSAYQFPVCEDPFGGIETCLNYKPYRGDTCGIYAFKSVSCYNDPTCCQNEQQLFNSGKDRLKKREADNMSFQLF